MIEALLNFLSGIVIAIISAGGYLGIVLAMTIESACIPLPSEVIMPFSGYLASTGAFTLLGITLAGAFGNVVGSVIAYYIGAYGGRPFIEKYGKYMLMREKDIEIADKWFQKYGQWVTFFSRMLPIIRTFISLPAGMARMPFVKFVILTFLGSVPWCLMLGYIGLKLGQHWHDIHNYFKHIDVVIAVLLLAGIIYFIWHHLPKKQRIINE